jgi:hypothetical protein
VGRSEGQGVRRAPLTDVVRLMAAHLDMTREAAGFMLAKGNVKLDGKTIGLEERHLPVDALAGRMLCAGNRCARVLGSRLAQRALPVNAAGSYPHFAGGGSETGRSLRLQSEDEQLSLIP